ncbi:hypothetical protein [Lacticaseibacillus manihotivorans]|uniref:hypothetical protein n=1 Tax=Lacticaseibacillus manihotivorans TaxID=88233 RepID=UPI001FB52CFF|nr:hypothetical protein [Lacticaseibacillus manihotivorans]
MPAGSKAYPLYHYEKATTAAKTQSNTDLTALGTAINNTKDAAEKKTLQDALSKFKTSYQAEQDANAAQYSTAKGYLSYVKTSLNDKGTDAEGDPTGLISAIQASAPS